MRFADVPDHLASAGWTLERALPRDATHALLQLRDAGGRSVAGQWFADPGRARRVAEQTAHAVSAAAVERPIAGVVVQHDGADRRIPELARRCLEPGSRLRAHRPERRAVVELGCSDSDERRFVKLVRSGRLTPALLRASTILIDGVTTPAVRMVDEAGASITTAALPGRTLHELLLSTSAGSLLDDMVEVGRMLARLHAATAPPGLLGHGPEAEIAVVDRWSGLAADLGVDGGVRAAVAAGRVRLPRLLAAARPVRTLLHRDLHDKQVVLSPADPALLDLDLLSLGDPALDLANLVVHLELRARQGLIEVGDVAPLVAALVAGYRPDARTRAAARGYQLATRLRLACVYAFRPASAKAAATVLTHPLTQELS